MLELLEWLLSSVAGRRLCLLCANLGGSSVR